MTTQKKRPITNLSVPANEPSSDQEMMLIKLVAKSGTCSRRKADILIKEGAVSINGTIIKEPWHITKAHDIVTVQGKRIRFQQTFFYILLNKPKDYLCTAVDPEKRQTIFDLIKHPKLHKIRLHYIGRLDRDSTGIIILTNNGALTQKLAHPRYNIKKTYEISLDRALETEHLQAIRKGLTLKDGFIKVDEIKPLENRYKHTFLVTIHSGKNRIIRRIFERVGYKVRKLDRISFGPFYKKGLARGMWRFIDAEEIKPFL